MVSQSLAHYRILKLLGQGGTGEVYLVEDLSLERKVALKVLPEALRHDPERLARFRAEACAAAKLNHPNIAAIYSIEEADITDVETRHVASLLFITMEYVDGQPLTIHLPSDGLPLDQFFAWFIPLADALCSAHEHGVTHLNLKPGNIMVSSDGIPKLLDFGLAWMMHPEPDETTSEASTGRLGQAWTTPGTPAYLSPEQVEGRPVDARSDIFSFGVMLYEAVTGQQPFKGESPVSIIGHILVEEPAEVAELKPDIPYLLGRLIKKCLQKDYRHRYQTMRDVLNELNEVKQDLNAGVVVETRTAAPHVDVPAPAPRWRRLTTRSAAGLLVALIAIVAWLTTTYRLTSVEVPWADIPAHRGDNDERL